MKIGDSGYEIGYDDEITEVGYDNHMRDCR